MLKKTKEKINNNEYVILFKKLWGNKRYRSILILVLYFIFFGIIIGVARSNYDYVEDIKPEITVLEKMEEWNNYENNYNYKILVNDIKLAQVKVEDGIINLNIDDKDYVIINNNIYLNKNDDLKKVKQISDVDIDIPIIKLNVKDIMNYLKTHEVESYKENSIKYQVLGTYFIDNLEENIEVELVGFDNLESININYKNNIIKLEIGE